MPLVGIAVTSAARTIGHWISFGITLVMMLGLVMFVAKQKKRRFGTSWHVKGPLILTVVAACLIMIEPSRHALQDTGAWPEASVSNLKSVSSSSIAYDSTNSMILLGDSSGSSNNVSIAKLKYDSGSVTYSGSIDWPQPDGSRVGGVHVSASTGDYYFSVAGYIAKYSTASGVVDPNWCSISANATLGGGLASDSSTLFVAGGDMPVVFRCNLADGEALEPLDVSNVVGERDANASFVNGVAVSPDAADTSVYVTFGYPQNQNPITYTVPSGLLVVSKSGASPAVLKQGDADTGIPNATGIVVDGDNLAITTSPGSRVYLVDKATFTVFNYNDLSDFVSGTYSDLAVADSSGNYFVVARGSEVSLYDSNFLGSGQYVHDPSRNCVSSNNEKMRCLTTLGAFTTIVCTYTGFILLAVGTMWNANLVGKLRDARDKWRELRS
mmetsp:Transcript_43727/g.85585  ORF Transcript_43727/g.85585 Transcript_43727/m.85585 type:complete len:440 (-) Transcript_43727:53-1372(-)